MTMQPWCQRIPSGPLIAPVSVVKLDSEGRVEWRGHVLACTGGQSYRVRIGTPRGEPSASGVFHIDEGIRVDLEHDQGFGYALQELTIILAEMTAEGCDVPAKDYDVVEQVGNTFIGWMLRETAACTKD